MKMLRYAGVALLCQLLVSGCGGGSAAPSSGASGDSGSPSVPLPGGSDLDFPRENIGRTSVRYAPRGLEGRAPLMVVLQPGFGTAAGFLELIGASDLADRHRFRVLAPRAPLLSWNSGGERGGGLDDVSFIRNEVLGMIAEGLADPGKIWLVGMSAGGFMAHRMLCEAGDLFAGAAMVAATATDEAPPGGPKVYPCALQASVPILTINGLSDTCVPFNGGESTGFRPLPRRAVPAVNLEWASRFQCGSIAEYTAAPGVNCQRYSSCRGRVGSRVEQCAIDHAGHGWPGAGAGLFNSMCGGGVSSFDATGAIWAFLSSLSARS